MAIDPRDCLRQVSGLLDEYLGADRAIQPPGTRRSLLGVSAGLTSEDTLYIISEEIDSYASQVPVETDLRKKA